MDLDLPVVDGAAADNLELLLPGEGGAHLREGGLVVERRAEGSMCRADIQCHFSSERAARVVEVLMSAIASGW